MTTSISEIRKDFPLLMSNDVIYLDTAATSQKPSCVLEAERTFYEKYNANPLRGLYELGEAATEKYEEARDILIHRYKENIFQKHSGAEEKRKLLALLIHKPINEISEQEAENILQHMPEKKWD
jgi:cysteine sulfinate desulfinase/cysteine desulfurase-like protein